MLVNLFVMCLMSCEAWIYNRRRTRRALRRRRFRQDAQRSALWYNRKVRSAVSMN
jgi:hypothetical protein